MTLFHPSEVAVVIAALVPTTVVMETNHVEMKVVYTTNSNATDTIINAKSVDCIKVALPEDPPHPLGLSAAIPIAPPLPSTMPGDISAEILNQFLLPVVLAAGPTFFLVD
jgi:hypothetical protein